GQKRSLYVPPSSSVLMRPANPWAAATARAEANTAAVINCLAIIGKSPQSEQPDVLSQTAYPFQEQIIPGTRDTRPAGVPVAGSAGFGEKRELARCRATVEVGQIGRIFASEAVIAALGVEAVPAVEAHGTVKPVDRQELQGVGTHEYAHFLDRHGGRQKLFPCRRIDAVVVAEFDLRAGDAHVNLARPGLPHHGHDLL